MVKNLLKNSAILAIAATQLFAAETLFSNSAYKVVPGSSTGKLLVFSIGDVASGYTEINLKVSSLGVSADTSKQTSIGDSTTAIQNDFFTGTLAERRRIPAEQVAGLGVVMPMYSHDGVGNFRNPKGFFSIRNIERIVETPLDPPSYSDDLDSTMLYAATGFSYDSTQKKLWIARGAAGLTDYDISKGVNDPSETNYIINNETKTLDKLKSNYRYKSKKNPSILDVKHNPQTGDLWIATEKGLWIKNGDKISMLKALDTSKRVTGIWMGGDPFQIIVETSKPTDDGVQGNLFRSYDSKNFKKINFLDTAGKVQKKDIFANSNYTVTSIAFLGKKAFVSVMSATAGHMESGYLELDSAGFRAWETDEDEGSQWLNGSSRGVTDRDSTTITSITAFPLTKKITGLAVSTGGNGISVSADSGATWTTILNRAKLSNNLGSIRMVPSVITAGGQSIVSYKVGKSSKITIEVFSYDMRKVRKIVKDAPREADNSRSTNPKEDFWDGLDEYGRPCTMGIYYVRVKDNHGHSGWGKVMTLGGNK